MDAMQDVIAVLLCVGLLRLFFVPLKLAVAFVALGVLTGLVLPLG